MECVKTSVSVVNFGWSLQFCFSDGLLFTRGKIHMALIALLAQKLIFM